MQSDRERLWVGKTGPEFRLMNGPDGKRRLEVIINYPGSIPRVTIELDHKTTMQMFDARRIDPSSSEKNMATLEAGVRQLMSVFNGLTPSQHALMLKRLMWYTNHLKNHIHQDLSL